MNAISIGTLALAGLYLLITFNYFGITESISATFYSWQKRDYSAAFFWFCIIVCFGACLEALIYPFRLPTGICLFFAGAFIGYVGIAATYKDSKVSTMHYVFAVLAIALGFAAVICEHFGTWRCWVPLTTFVVLGAAVKLWWPKNATYWIEVIALVLIFGFL